MGLPFLLNLEFLEGLSHLFPHPLGLVHSLNQSKCLGVIFTE